MSIESEINIGKLIAHRKGRIEAFQEIVRLMEQLPADGSAWSLIVKNLHNTIDLSRSDLLNLKAVFHEVVEDNRKEGLDL